MPVESPEIEVWVIKSHGKADQRSKVEKMTDKSENQLIPVKTNKK